MSIRLRAKKKKKFRNDWWNIIIMISFLNGLHYSCIIWMNGHILKYNSLTLELLTYPKKDPLNSEIFLEIFIKHHQWKFTGCSDFSFKLKYHILNNLSICYPKNVSKTSHHHHNPHATYSNKILKLHLYAKRYHQKLKWSANVQRDSFIQWHWMFTCFGSRGQDGFGCVECCSGVVGRSVG